MKTFKDYTGADGIEKLLEAAPYIEEIMRDNEVMHTDGSWIKLGGYALKNHEEAANKLLEALGGDDAPDNVLGKTAALANVLFEILTDKDISAFFTSLKKTDSTQTSAMESTADGQ